MAAQRLTMRPTQMLPRIELCIFCRMRPSLNKVQGFRLTNERARRARSNDTIRFYAAAAGQRYDTKRYRADVDKRARLGLYTLTKREGILKMQPHKADAIYTDFVAQKNNLDPGSNIKRLATKYQVSLEQLTSLALVTFKVPDLSDEARKAAIPPSQNKPTAGSMLRGCALAEEPLAIVHILTAMYLGPTNKTPIVRELLSIFTKNDLNTYQKTLDKLAARSKTFDLGPEALTLQGLFAENRGEKELAKTFYVEAVERSTLKFVPGSRHPMQLPLISPWNALGYLLKSDQNPDVREQAKAYFKKGAYEGDDPLSYYELAAFEDRSSALWLQYISKAAATGHSEAMARLADFYREVSVDESPLLTPSNRKSLNWLLSWKDGSAKNLAREWLQAASQNGHKPSSLQLADLCESTGDHEGAKEYLRAILEPPDPTANQIEEWPQLVHLAKRRLAGIKA